MSERECIREAPWNILCTVVTQEGTCAEGHKVGDRILFTSNGVEGKICISALYSIIPKVYAMMYNAQFPWLENQCVATHACPDGLNPVVFQLERVEP